jgi:methyl-accepting chemotaxis protein
MSAPAIRIPHDGPGGMPPPMSPRGGDPRAMPKPVFGRFVHFKSIRTKLLLLVAGVALLVGMVSATYFWGSSKTLLRTQVVKRGSYIAKNLAINSEYGVMIEDPTQLTDLVEAVAGAGADVGDAASNDVVAVIIRNAKGAILAKKGDIRDLPPQPATTKQAVDAWTVDGEPVILFRAPVVSQTKTGNTTGVVDFGVAPATAAGVQEQKGGVEVAISRRRMDKESQGILFKMLGLASGMFVVGAAAGWYLIGRWVDPIRRMVGVAGSVAEGDLTQTIPIIADDEVGTLAGSLNGMVGNLRRIVDNIQDTSVQVASSAGQISANARLITEGAGAQAQAAEETSTSMEEMAASIQTVAGNAQSLATHVEETSSSITEMGASIEEVAKSSATLAATVAEASATIEEMTVSIDQMARNLEVLAQTVSEASATIEEMTSSIEAVARNAEVMNTASARASQTVSEMAGAVNDVAKIAEEADRISNKAQDDARTGDEAVQKTVVGMRTISETMENTSRVIMGLGKRSQEIGKILEVIEEIADQTNLLALNAAIEAARAGEAGRGFAVVADEVRKLAERSVEATKEIGEVIRLVQAETTDAVETAKVGASHSKEGLQLTDKAGLALRSIIDSVSRSSQLMARIASSTARQSQASAEVLRTVADMNAATEQVTTAVREQAAGSKQIRQAMENINRITTQVNYATKEQAAGGRQVRLSVENMNKIASQVNIATKEQAEGSRQIVRAVENMNRMTQQVSYATAEQKRGGELVVKAMENISEIARDNLSTVEQMSKATQNLATQAENLAKLISVFRLQ